MRNLSNSLFDFTKSSHIRKALTTLFFVSLILTFSSCSSSDDSSAPEDYVEALQGTWDFQKGTMSVLGQSVTITAEELDSFAEQLGVSDFFDKTLYFSGNTCNGQSYKIDGKTFLWDAYGEANDMMEVTIKTLTDSKLVFHIKYTIPEFGNASGDFTYARR